MIRKRKFLGGNGFSGELHRKIRLSKKHDMRIYYSRRFLDLVFILFWVVVVLVHTHIDTIYTNSNKLNSISSSDIQRMQQYFTMTKKAHTKKEFLLFHWGTHFVNSCLKTFLGLKGLPMTYRTIQIYLIGHRLQFSSVPLYTYSKKIRQMFLEIYYEAALM